MPSGVVCTAASRAPTQPHTCRVQRSPNVYPICAECSTTPLGADATVPRQDAWFRRPGSPTTRRSTRRRPLPLGHGRAQPGRRSALANATDKAGTQRAPIRRPVATRTARLATGVRAKSMSAPAMIRKRPHRLAIKRLAPGTDLPRRAPRRRTPARAARWLRAVRGRMSRDSPSVRHCQQRADR